MKFSSAYHTPPKYHLLKIHPNKHADLCANKLIFNFKTFKRCDKRMGSFLCPQLDAFEIAAISAAAFGVFQTGLIIFETRYAFASERGFQFANTCSTTRFKNRTGTRFAKTDTGTWKQEEEKGRPLGTQMAIWLNLCWRRKRMGSGKLARVTQTLLGCIYAHGITLVMV